MSYVNRDGSLLTAYGYVLNVSGARYCTQFMPMPQPFPVRFTYSMRGISANAGSFFTRFAWDSEFLEPTNTIWTVKNERTELCINTYDPITLQPTVAVLESISGYSASFHISVVPEDGKELVNFGFETNDEGEYIFRGVHGNLPKTHMAIAYNMGSRQRVYVNGNDKGLFNVGNIGTGVSLRWSGGTGPVLGHLPLLWVRWMPLAIYICKELTNIGMLGT